jgi:hypothetical protein
MQTREQAEQEYDEQLDRLVTSLHALANEAARAGDARRPRFDGISSTRVAVDRMMLATDVQHLILRWAGQQNSHLVCLIFAALRAEHASARSTPGELLDQAITGLEGIMGAADATPTELADLALRGAGVIR